MPKAFPKDFKVDVLRVANSRGQETSIEQVAKDFGVSASCLQRWIKQEVVDDGVSPGLGTAELTGNRALRRRNRRREQGYDVLRRAAAYLSQANLKLGGSPK